MFPIRVPVIWSVQFIKFIELCTYMHNFLHVYISVMFLKYGFCHSCIHGLCLPEETMHFLRKLLMPDPALGLLLP